MRKHPAVRQVPAPVPWRAGRAFAAQTGHAPGAELPASIREVLGSGGEPLDAATRARMQSRFGHDFGNVRVHADSRASAAARSMDADAFTVGTAIAFGPGTYAPATARGRALLAHELAHVIQQSQGHGRVAGQRQAGDAAETEATSASRAAAAGHEATVRPGSRPVEVQASARATRDQEVTGRIAVPYTRRCSLDDFRATFLEPRVEELVSSWLDQGRIPATFGSSGLDPGHLAATIRSALAESPATYGVVNVYRVSIRFDPDAGSLTAVTVEHAERPLPGRPAITGPSGPEGVSIPPPAGRPGSRATQEVPQARGAHEPPVPTHERARRGLEDVNGALSELRTILEWSEALATDEASKELFAELQRELAKVHDPLSRMLEAERIATASAKLVHAIGQAAAHEPGSEAAVEAVVGLAEPVGELLAAISDVAPMGVSHFLQALAEAAREFPGFVAGMKRKLTPERWRGRPDFPYL